MINGQRIGRVSAAISTEISADSRPICRPSLGRYIGRYVDRYIGRGVHKNTHGPQFLGSIGSNLALCDMPSRLLDNEDPGVRKNFQIKFLYLWKESLKLVILNKLNRSV